VITDYSPFSVSTMADPASAYRYLHAQAPVHYYAKNDPPFYTLSKYHDVADALRDIELFSSHWGQGPRFTEPMGMLSNPPQHTFFRSLVQQKFTPASIRGMKPWIERLAEQLLDDIDDARTFDVHDDFAFPLPVIIICRILGIPEEHIEKFKMWSDASVEAMGAEDPTPWMEKLEAMAAFQLEQVEARRHMDNPPDDLVTLLTQVEREGEPLPTPQILSVFNQLFVGGNETTTSLITNCVWRLLERRELWERLVAEPGLVETAIEESLRFDPPVLGLFRTTTREVQLRGVTIPENAKVMLHYAAANRDPEVFENPDEFMLDRKMNKKHLAFGLGTHFCLGSELARLEARTALGALVRRFPDLTFENAGERIKPFFLWGRKRLPVHRG